MSLTHDQLNNPQLADPLYASWLRTARDDGVLDKSVVVFLSDHGIRWGDIRETYQGRLEERLPFLMVSPLPFNLNVRERALEGSLTSPSPCTGARPVIFRSHARQF